MAARAPLGGWGHAEDADPPSGYGSHAAAEDALRRMEEEEVRRELRAVGLDEVRRSVLALEELDAMEEAQQARHAALARERQQRDELARALAEASSPSSSRGAAALQERVWGAAGGSGKGLQSRA